MSYAFRLMISSILIVSSIISVSCSSSVRYTTKDNTKNNSITKKSYTNLEEIYRDYKSLDSKIETASYYSDEFHGKKTANGEIYNMYDYTAAHINFPFNTIVRVTNLSNDREVILRINDRKPDTNGRAIDISLKAAHELRMISSGIAKVRVEVLKRGDK